MAYLPPLRTKLNVDFLPDIVSNISGGINNLIDNIVLREFQELQDNDAHSYFAVLRTKQKVEFDVFGSE